MSTETVPGSKISYKLISYDAEGCERGDDPEGLMSGRTLDAIADASVTDVFLLSHGWRGDVPAARSQYGRWIAAMAGCNSDVARIKAKRPHFRPLLVGLHWPSEPWGDDSLAGAASFGTAGADPVGELVEEAAAKTVDTPAARAALRIIVTSALADNNPPRLPDEVRAAYAALDRETGMGHGGEAATPGDDREPFDAEAIYQGGQEATFSFGGFTDGVLSPLRTLSFWTMKDRARRFGEAGAHQLLAILMRAAAGRDVRFHFMGHSFGCIVASAAVTGPEGSTLPAPIDSLVLIQGALSLWSYCSDIPSAPGRPAIFAGSSPKAGCAGPSSRPSRASTAPWGRGIRGRLASGVRPRFPPASCRSTAP
jgi:hypothetical protein